MTDAAIFCNRCGAQNAPTVQFCSNCGTALGVAPAGVRPAPVAAVHWAGFWIRFIAIIIDVILIQIVLSPLRMMGFVGGVLGSRMHTPVPGLASLFAIVPGISVLVSWLYEALMESSAQQATLGKMIFGLKVTDLQGNRISFARATGRHFAKIISAMIILIGFIMAGLNERKQALHDMIAGTLVRYR
jgi:uncharacterized RDD family membrane protein YckC